MSDAVAPVIPVLEPTATAGTPRLLGMARDGGVARAACEYGTAVTLLAALAFASALGRRSARIPATPAAPASSRGGPSVDMCADACRTGAASALRSIVSIDGSPSSEQALTRGDYLASAMGGVLEAVTAWQGPSSWTGVADDWDPTTKVGAILSGRCAKVFGAAPPTGPRVTVRESAAAAVLLTASAGARIPVLGSRGHGGSAGLLRGSVSAACPEHADRPTLIIHGEGLPPAVAPDTGQNSRARETEGTR
ncbi:universal stress protein [Streptomyces sp. 2MCAF27]